MNLPQIEERIFTLLNTINHHDHAQKYIELGNLLREAKDQQEKGDWLNWLRRFRLSPRTTQTWMQIAEYAERSVLPKDLSQNAYLRFLRAARRAAKAKDREQARQEAIAHAGTDDDRYQVHHADCRKFRWPKTIDVIATDPNWFDFSHYEWLATFAAKHLREGSPCFVQCANSNMSEIMAIMASKLTYIWTMAIVYDEAWGRIALPFHLAWCPVLVFAKGNWNTEGLDKVSDTVTMYNMRLHVKNLHDWQQPVKPWHYWLLALTRPNDLIADPFTGSGTNGTAAKGVGVRRFLGTEIDAETAKIAQGRINQHEEGTKPTD